MSQRKRKGTIRSRGNSWQVDFGVIDGRRVQKSFKSKDEAKQWAQLKETAYANNQSAVFDLNERQRIDAVEAFSHLAEKLGTSIQALPLKDVSLTRVVDYYLKHARPEGGQRTVKEVCEHYLQTKMAAGRRPRTMQDLTSRMGRFSKAFGDRRVHEISTADLEQWMNVKGYKGLTRRNYRTHLTMLFNFARKRKWISDNPAEDIEVPLLDETIPAILTVQECQRLLGAAQTHYREMVPYLAIALFAGLRPAEAEKLDWANISFENKTIKVSPETAKKRRMRYVDMSANLMEWLLPYRRPSGVIFYSRREFEAVRKKAKVRWHNDVLRHSYGSYHLARDENAAKTSLQMGHRDPEVLFNHYRNLVTRDDAKAFWEIVPRQEQPTVIPIEQAG